MWLSVETEPVSTDSMIDWAVFKKTLVLFIFGFSLLRFLGEDMPSDTRSSIF